MQAQFSTFSANHVTGYRFRVVRRVEQWTY